MLIHREGIVGLREPEKKVEEQGQWAAKGGPEMAHALAQARNHGFTMKYCYQCGHISSGQPLFCMFCGRTYDVKLCPRHHANPRYADCCSQCGSRELSTPQPKVSVWWRILEWLALMVVGAFAILISAVLVFEFLKAVFGTPEGQAALVGLGILSGALWCLWALLPDWFRKLVRKQFRNGRDRHENQ